MCKCSKCERKINIDNDLFNSYYINNETYFVCSECEYILEQENIEFETLLEYVL